MLLIGRICSGSFQTVNNLLKCNEAPRYVYNIVIKLSVSKETNTDRYKNGYISTVRSLVNSSQLYAQN